MNVEMQNQNQNKYQNGEHRPNVDGRVDCPNRGSKDAKVGGTFSWDGFCSSAFCLLPSALCFPKKVQAQAAATATGQTRPQVEMAMAWLLLPLIDLGAMA